LPSISKETPTGRCEFEKEKNKSRNLNGRAPTLDGQSHRSGGKGQSLVRQGMAVLAYLVFCAGLLFAILNYGPQLFRKFMENSLGGVRQDSTTVRAVGPSEIINAVGPLGWVTFVESDFVQIMRDTLREDRWLLRDDWVSIAVPFRGQLKVLIDFSHLSEGDVTIRSGTVTLRLPPPEYQVMSIHYSPNEVLTDNHGDIEHDWMLAAIQSLQTMAEDSVLTRAERDPDLAELCEQNASQFLEECLGSLGFHSVEIVFNER
jgi:hypothetical protein